MSTIQGKFRKKPVVIEAWQYNGCNNPFGAAKINSEGRSYIETMHDGQTVILEAGDWVIPDGKPGTYYPCKPDVFEKTYEAVTGASESGSPKWVKAETDLPKAKGYYITRRPTLNNKQWIIKHVPHNPKYDDTYIHVWRFYGLEWLDETPSPSVNDRIEKLEAALRELVELKDMKDKITQNIHAAERTGLAADYHKRKPLAWKAARELLNIKP
jgi:hypothetical protein